MTTRQPQPQPQPQQNASEQPGARSNTISTCWCRRFGDCTRDPKLTTILAALHQPACTCACHDEKTQQAEKVERRVTP